MVSCCGEGIWGSASPSSVEIIRPGSTSPTPCCSGCGENAKIIRVLEGENGFGWGPLAMASYPAIAMVLPKADEQTLKSSLAKALQAVPTAAGRFCQNGRGLQLNDAGVPFRVVSSNEKRAPERLEEVQLLDFADFPNPATVYKGKAPVMTVKLTKFQDGSGVLCMCRSHMLFDGTSAWTFVAYWSALARGQEPKPPIWDKDQAIALVPDEEETQQIALQLNGRRLKWSPLNVVMKATMVLFSSTYDALFRNAGVGLYRDRLFFADAELAALKSFATPKTVEPGKDNWVSTQEAFVAYMIHTLGQQLVSPTAKGACKVVFFLDPRKSVGLPANQLLGSGLVLFMVKIDNFRRLSLPEIASELHEALSTKESGKKLGKQWRLITGACEIKKVFDIYMEYLSTSGCDLVLQINNSSKRELPDFGNGRCEQVVTNAGPTLLLPAKGGMEVFLHSSVFSSTGCSSAQKQKALEALRSELPRSTA